LAERGGECTCGATRKEVAGGESVVLGEVTEVARGRGVERDAHRARRAEQVGEHDDAAVLAA
jgi:hypothetical protein